MTTATLPHTRIPIPVPAWLANTRAMVLAGAMFATAGIIILMGIITAEAVYDHVYTTNDNEISDLGATRPPDSVSYQPSSGIFNATMLVGGAAVLIGSLALRSTADRRRVWLPVMLLGIGMIGVGVFPGNRAPFHGIFALMTFISGGVAAILVKSVLAQPLRAISIGLGAITLGSLAFAIAGAWTPLYDALGDGGVERWVAYPVVLWITMFGGYLMGRTDSS